jgi:hypothetical protein
MREEFDERWGGERSSDPTWVVAGGVLVLVVLLVLGLGGAGFFWYVRAQRQAAMVAAEQAMYDAEQAQRAAEKARAAGAGQAWIDDDAWAELWEEQKGLWAWPPVLRERFVRHTFGDELDADLRDVYAREENYPAQVRALTGLIAPARFGDKSPQGVVGHFNSTGGPPPSSEDVWLAAETLAVRAELLRAITSVNKWRSHPAVTVIEEVAQGSDALAAAALHPARFSADAPPFTASGQSRLRYTALGDRVRRLPVRVVVVLEDAAVPDVLAALRLCRLQVRLRENEKVRSSDLIGPNTVRLRVSGVASLAERPGEP